MEQNALNRFKFQELCIANNLRKYLSKAADGINEDLDIENFSDITDFNFYYDQLENGNNNLEDFLIFNLDRLPSGTNIQSMGLVLKNFMEKMCEEECMSMSKEQEDQVRESFRLSLVKVKKMPILIKNVMNGGNLLNLELDEEPDSAKKKVKFTSDERLGKKKTWDRKFNNTLACLS